MKNFQFLFGLVFSILLIATTLFGIPIINMKGILSNSDLNKTLLLNAKLYPTNGSITQTPKELTNRSIGTTKSIVYNDKIIFSSKSHQHAYCSGLVFETFLDSMRQTSTPWRKSRYLGMNESEFRKFQTQFYGADGNILIAKNNVAIKPKTFPY